MRTGLAVFFSLVLIASIGGILWFEYSKRTAEPEAGSARYPDFGVNIPLGYRIVGIDVSRYQGKIRFADVCAMTDQGLKVGFVFVKATEGGRYVDPKFFVNWKSAGLAGLPRGAYHYFRPGTKAADQLRNFTRTVHLSKGDLPPVLDVEETGSLSKKAWLERVGALLKGMQQHYGVKPIIYCNYDYYKRLVKGNFDAYPIWIAHYGVSKPGMSSWTFWQMSDRGSVNGISGDVDFNVFQGDSLAFKRLLIK
jgi:lysozyme